MFVLHLVQGDNEELACAVQCLEQEIQHLGGEGIQSNSERVALVRENNSQSSRKCFFSWYDTVETYMRTRTYPRGATRVMKTGIRNASKNFCLKGTITQFDLNTQLAQCPHVMQTYSYMGTATVRPLCPQHMGEKNSHAITLYYITFIFGRRFCMPCFTQRTMIITLVLHITPSSQPVVL